MKCRYTFHVSSRLRLGATFPVEYRGYVFSFVRDTSVRLTQIVVEFAENDRYQWPTFTPLGNGPIKGKIHVLQPRYDELSAVVRFLEGILSFYGVDAVNVEEPLIEWLPETNEERGSLQISSFSRHPDTPDLSAVPEAKLGLLAQSLYAFDSAWQLEPLFNFVRRGIVAIRDERFIDAIYNFYFYLEAQFGRGKSRNYDVRTEFCSSDDLLSAIDRARDGFDYRQHPHRQAIYSRFDSHYKGRSSAQIARQIVELRGFLHHYNRARPKIWHPSDKWSYAADGFLLGEIVVPLARQESVVHVLVRPASTGS